MFHIYNYIAVIGIGCTKYVQTTHLKSTALGNRLARRLCYLLGSQCECFKNDEVVRERSKTFCDLFWWGWSFATNWASFGLSNSRLLASCSFTVHCGDSWNVTVPNVLGVLSEHWMPTQPNQLHNCKSVFHKKEMLNAFLWINVGSLCCILGFLVGNSAISGCLQHPAHCVEKASGFYFPNHCAQVAGSLQLPQAPAPEDSQLPQAEHHPHLSGQKRPHPLRPGPTRGWAWIRSQQHIETFLV